jgi:regulator of sirC expression with transglutaminase-like and TPR domain
MDVDMTLERLGQDPAAPFDLAEIALHLARDEYPDVDVEATLGELAGMGHEARRYIRGSLEARVYGLCRYLFHDMGFRGNIRDYYDPRNSYLNVVLERRTGLPIALAAVAMAVGKRAGLHVAGVGLPGHFIAKVVSDGQEVLFDPFHGGRLLAPEQCEILVEQVTSMPFQATPEALAETPLGSIILRMLTNLKGSYLQLGDFARAARVIGRLRLISPDDPLQHRDLGVCLLRAEQPGKAVAHLEGYLHAMPEAEDAAAVRKFLDQARAELAQWN